MAATSYIRSLGVPCSQYIDDRHVGQLQLPFSYHNPHFSHSQLANMAAFITCAVLISLGYFIGLTKSCFEPSTAVRFLGYICDSTFQAFILPEDKKVTFAKLRDEILKNNSVSLKNLQKFAGKTTSFALVVPAAKLYTNTAYHAIAKANRSCTTKILILEHLRREILHWTFLDNWKGCLPWKSEVHRLVKMYSDASNTGWGGILLRENAAHTEMRGYWEVSERQLPISARESLALLRVLENLPAEYANARLDVLSDSQVLIGSWERQVSACEISSDILKRIFEVSSSKNLDINLFFVPSKVFSISYHCFSTWKSLALVINPKVLTGLFCSLSASCGNPASMATGCSVSRMLIYQRHDICVLSTMWVQTKTRGRSTPLSVNQCRPGKARRQTTRAW